MFHPIVIRQETEAQCAGTRRLDKGVFIAPGPGRRSVWRPPQRMTYDNCPVFSCPPWEPRAGTVQGAALAPPHGGRVRSVPAAAWTPAHVAPPSLQTAAWGRAPPPKREVQTGRRRSWAAGPSGSSPAGEGDCADGGGGALRTAELQTRSRGPSPVWSRWGLRSICHSPRGADTISLLQTVSGAGDR